MQNQHKKIRRIDAEALDAITTRANEQRQPVMFYFQRQNGILNRPLVLTRARQITRDEYNEIGV